jgi:hypothetical protein
MGGYIGNQDGAAVIGVHVECDNCRLFAVWYCVPVSDAKKLARRAGWMVGKEETLCENCRTTKWQNKPVKPERSMVQP